MLHLFLTCCAVLRFLQLLVLRWIILWFLLLPPQKRLSIGSPSWRKCVHHSRPQLPPLKWTKSDHVLKSFKLFRFTDSSHATKKIRRKRRDTRENERLPPYCFAYFPCCIPFWKTPKHFVPKSHSSSLLPEVFHQQDVSAGRIVVHIMCSIVLSMFWGGSFAITNPCRFPPTWPKLRSTCGVVYKRELQTAKETKSF